MPKAAFHLARYLLGIDPAQTQTTAAERAAIARHAAGKRLGLEIGVFEGVTTGVIASALAPEGTLYGIDPFLGGRIGICWGKPIARREAYRYKPKCQIVFVEDFSHEASARVAGSFDFVFIDGDHSWDGIVQDWADWSARVLPGGIIALHDTSVPKHNPGVADLGSHRYFVEHIQHDERFEHLDHVDSLNVLRRR